MARHGRVGPSSVGTLGAPSLLLQRPRDCHELGEIRPEVHELGSVSQNADRHHSRKGVSD